MIDLPYYETLERHIKVGEFCVYTKNHRVDNKYIFMVKAVDSDSLSLWNIHSESNFMLQPSGKYHSESAFYIAPFSEMTEHEVKSIVSLNSYEDYLTFKGNLRKKSKKFFKKDVNPYNPPEKSMSTIQKLTRRNTAAAKEAAQITAGKALLKTASTKAKPHLPMMVRGYADHPLGQLVLANLVRYGVDELMPANEKAVWIANGMIIAAMAEFMDTFDLEGMLKDLLGAEGEMVSVAVEKPVRKKASKSSK